MKRLIHIWLRGGNIILKSAGERSKHIVNYTECIIAVNHCINYNSYCIYIIDFLKVLAFNIDLTEDTVNGFNSGGNLHIIHNRLKFSPDLGFYILEENIALARFHGKRVLYFLISDRVKIVNCQILKFVLNASYTETMGDGGVNFKSFKRFFSLLIRRHMLECSHIMESVGKFNNYHTHILIHGDEHFSYVFCLNFLFGGERNFAEFCNSVNKGCDLLAEICSDIIKRISCILYDIVKKRTDNTFVIHAEVKKNFCNGNGVHNIRLARASALIFMSVICKIVRLFDQVAVILRILFYFLKELAELIVIVL